MPLRPSTLALALSLIVALGATDADAAKKKRKSTSKKAVVEKVDACSDFYGYTHKAWLDSNLYVGGSGMTTAMSQLRERALQQQIDLLNADMTAQGGLGKLLGDFWASGLDEAAVEADGANPIAPLLDRINGIRRDKDIAPAIAALHQVGIPALFNFSANIDLADFERHVGYFTQGGLGLPDPAWYTRNDADTTALFSRYQDYVKQILTLTGSPADKVDGDLAAVLDLEKRIAGISKPIAQLRDPRASYALVPTAGLAKQYRKLQLHDFLKAQGVTDDTVSMADSQFFAQLDTLVDTLKPDQWKAYLRYQVGAAMAPYLSKPWREADFDFRGRVLRGQIAPGTRQKQVLDAINLAAGPMLARDYTTRYLPDATRQRATALATEVRDALGRGIERNTWMSEAAKEQAKAKLAKLKIEVGAPARDLDYSVQPMGRGSFGSNMLIASTWRHREEMKRIGRGNADRRWDVLPQEPALAYDIAHNRLIVTAAMLQAPVLDMGQDAASHYGSFGALVGHELSHAFDNKGRQVDAAGTLRDWWTPADTAAWDARANQVGAQFNAYAYPNVPGIFVNGSLTRDENMADLAGVELAWDALQTAQPGAGEAGAKSFFNGWARLWPQQMSADVATLLATTDVHAPGQWRTNAPLVNQSSFAQAFGCKASKTNKMVLGKDQAPIEVWNLQSNPVIATGTK